MPTPSSGSVGLSSTIAACSSGSSYAGSLTTNVGMNNFTLGGTYIPNIVVGGNQSIPTTTSNMSFNAYRSVWGYKRMSFTVTAGQGYGDNLGPGKSAYLGYGYAGAYGTAYNQQLSSGVSFGSISAGTFTTPNGLMQINSYYYGTGSGYNFVDLGCSTALPGDNDFSFIGIGNSRVYNARSSRAGVYNVSYAYNRCWYISAGTSAFPSGSGTYTCYINYYG